MLQKSLPFSFVSVPKLSTCERTLRDPSPGSASHPAPPSQPHFAQSGPLACSRTRPRHLASTPHSPPFRTEGPQTPGRLGVGGSDLLLTVCFDRLQDAQVSVPAELENFSRYTLCTPSLTAAGVRPPGRHSSSPPPRRAPGEQSAFLLQPHPRTPISLISSQPGAFCSCSSSPSPQPSKKS